MLNNVFVNTSVIPKESKMQLAKLKLRKNFIISFKINLISVATEWKQILGITKSNVGDDIRCPGIWICPNTTNLHIMIKTNSNWNTPITNCVISTEIGKTNRFDIIRTHLKYEVYKNGEKVVETTLDDSMETQTGNAYVFTTFYPNQHPDADISDVVVMYSNVIIYAPYKVDEALSNEIISNEVREKINLTLDELSKLSINDLSNIIKQINIQNEQIQNQLQQNDSNKSNHVKSQYQNIEIDKLEEQNKYLYLFFYILVFILAFMLIYKKPFSYITQSIIIVFFLIFPFFIYYIELLLYIMYKYSVNFLSSTPFSNVYITNY